jgi:hypothetical protein
MKTIYAAFVKAQKAFGPALKTSTNPHFRSKYADLSACVEAVIDALNNNGIGLIQTVHECNNGALVETIFIHESGESLSCGKLHVPATKQDAHGFGSALTYARRYGLMSACGIAPEDCDGNAAVASVKPPQKTGRTPGEIVGGKKVLEGDVAKIVQAVAPGKLTPTTYDLSPLDETKRQAARDYLLQNGAVEISENRLKTKFRLERLTQYVVDSNEENT